MEATDGSTHYRHCQESLPPTSLRGAEGDEAIQTQCLPWIALLSSQPRHCEEPQATKQSRRGACHGLLHFVRNDGRGDDGRRCYCQVPALLCHCQVPALCGYCLAIYLYAFGGWATWLEYCA